jgi:biotin carboxyl carrier protein
MNYNQIVKIMDTFKKLDLSKLHYEEKNNKLFIEKNNSITVSKNANPNEILQIINDDSIENNINIVEIKSPTVGRIKISNQLSKGSIVKKGDKLFSIETMKVMNDVLSPCDGTIEYLEKDNIFVEYDQTIMRIKSNEK